jgi:hypothetical protein
MSWRRIVRKIRERGSLRGLARWTFLGTLVLAPWFYGGTTAWAIELTDGLLGLSLGLWILSLVVDWRRPLVPLTLVIIAAAVLLHGWWMVLNARAVYDGGFRFFVPLAPFAPQLTGSADYVLSLAMMTRVTLLIGAIFLVAEMAQRPRWLLRLWITLAVSGGLIALLGLVQKATGAKMIFWGPPVWPPIGTFFATYLYHANAGAFLNLVLPAVVGLTCWSAARRERSVARAFLTGAAMIVLLAIFSNTSRMAQAVGLLLVVALLATVARPLMGKAVRAEKKTLIIGAVVGAIAIFAVAQAAHLDEPLGRWQMFTKQFPEDQRWAANRAAFSSLGDAGVLGLGPGVFRAVFPHYQEPFRAGLQGTWRFLHDDYLQTVLEWGWLGALALAGLFFGGIAVALRSYFTAKGWGVRQEILLVSSMLALGGVALHATVDFPLQIFSIQILAATYVGICWASVGWKREVRKQSSEARGRKSDGRGQKAEIRPITDNP